MLHRQPELMAFEGKKFYLAHGDGLGPGDRGYKLMKKVFSNHFNQWLFRWLHPDIGSGLALYFSRKSRISNDIKDRKREASLPPFFYSPALAANLYCGIFSPDHSIKD